MKKLLLLTLILTLYGCGESGIKVGFPPPCSFLCVEGVTYLHTPKGGLSVAYERDGSIKLCE